MQHILELIRQNGDLFYLITFIWTALEGETFVIFAGLAAQRGLLNIYPLFAAAALGSMFGDQVFFFVGRYFGRWALARKPSMKPKLDKILVILEKYAVAFILSYRFMYGVRNISALAIGMSPISWKRFAFWNAVASFLWSAVFCGGGYLFGNILDRMGLADEDSVNLEVRGLTIGVLVIFMIIVGLRYWAIKRKAAAQAEETEENNLLFLNDKDQDTAA